MPKSIDRILVAARYGWPDLAKQIGKAYSTVASFASNRREVSPDVMLDIADAFEKKAEELQKLAAELRKRAGE